MNSDGVRKAESKVPPQFHGATLLDYLTARFTYRDQAQWSECIVGGSLLVNGGPASPQTILHKNDVVRLLLSEKNMVEPDVCRDFQIVAETPQYIVVNKPGNLPIHPSGKYFNNTLLRLLQPDFGDLYPVNRLDRETSGIVLFAKDGESAKRLSMMFTRHAVQKTYLALVYGNFPETEIDASGFLSTDSVSLIHKKQKFSTTAPNDTKCQSAHTRFKILECKNGYSLLECFPETGRMHQIRATLLALGYPVVGDKLYGLDETIFLRFREDKMTEADHVALKMDRQSLHAWRLQFISPFNGVECSYEAPCPFTFPESPA